MELVDYIAETKKDLDLNKNVYDTLLGKFVEQPAKFEECDREAQI